MLVYCSPSTNNSLWGAKPPLPCSSRVNVVISPNLWHGRVPRYIPSPLKSPCSLFLSAIGLIVCDCHDKRLRFSRFLVRLFFTIFVVVLFFRSFSSKWPSFCISEKYLPVNRNFKNLNFRNISTLLRSNFLLLRPLVVFFCPAGRLRCANLAEWHIT